MDINQKRAFVQSAIWKADEALIETLYQELKYNLVLKKKLSNRARRAEDDIKNGLLMDFSAFRKALADKYVKQH